MKRHERLLHGLPVATGLGLEFGPLANPVVRKDQGRIVYVDYTDTGTLRSKAANDPKVDEAAVVDIDVDLQRGSLVEQCGPLGPFDYAVASHVFEHLPNPAGWLRDVASLLVPGGAVALAVPDRRYTFDFFRAETTTAQLVAFDLEGLVRPCLAQLADHYYHVRRVDTAAAWAAVPMIENVDRHHDDEQVTRILGRAIGGKHVDCHCTVWTSEQFSRVIPDVIRLQSLPLRIRWLDDPVPGSNEFLVQLERV